MKSIMNGILNKTQSRIQYIEEIIGQSLHKDAEVCSIVDIKKEKW